MATVVTSSASAVSSNNLDAETERFYAAVKIINNLPKEGPFQASSEMRLRFYALYKQATVGRCKVAKPGFWDVVNRAKWDAWNSLGDMSKEEAMKNYIDCLKQIIETMSFDSNVQEFLEKIDPFFEFVQKETHCSPVFATSSLSNCSVTNGHLPKSLDYQSPSTAENQCEFQKNISHPSEAVETVIQHKIADDGVNSSDLQSEDETFADADDDGFLIVGNKMYINGNYEEVFNEAWNAVEKVENERRRRCALRIQEDLQDYCKGNNANEFAKRKMEKKSRGRDEDSKQKSGDAASSSAGKQETEGQPSASASGRVSEERESRGRGRKSSRNPSGSEESSGSGESPDMVWDPRVAGVMFRMHREVQQIGRQLDLLEEMLVTQQRLLHTTLGQLLNQPRKVWFISNLSWKTIAFIVLWPFIVNFVVRYFWRKVLLRGRRR